MKNDKSNGAGRSIKCNGKGKNVDTYRCGVNWVKLNPKNNPEKDVYTAKSGGDEEVKLKDPSKTGLCINTSVEVTKEEDKKELERAKFIRGGREKLDASIGLLKLDDDGEAQTRTRDVTKEEINFNFRPNTKCGVERVEKDVVDENAVGDMKPELREECQELRATMIPMPPAHWLKRTNK